MNIIITAGNSGNVIGRTIILLNIVFEYMNVTDQNFLSFVYLNSSLYSLYKVKGLLNILQRVDL